MTRFASLTCVVALLGLVPLASANPEGGAFSGTRRVEAFSSTLHSVLYRGGEQADFSVYGDGTTTLNVIVEDQNGFEIVRTRGPGDRCHVSWNPPRGGVYYIRVVNEGPVWNLYRYYAY